jgi:hypothetical protein
LRVLHRERYLTGSARSIPIVIVLDEAWREIGHRGPRPAAPQAWVKDARKATPTPPLYPQLRRWYAGDHGETTLREALALLPAVTPQ